MASSYEVEVKLSSAKDIKNVNWRHGRTRPYAVIWVDPKNKFSTRADEEGDTSPHWDEKLVIPVPGQIKDATLYIDIFHAGSEEDSKPLIGSARLPLVDVLDDVGFGEFARRTLELKRPSGRPQGKVEVKVTVREPRYRAPDPYYAPPYGVPPPRSVDPYPAPRDPYAAHRDPYVAPPNPYAAQPNPYYSAVAPPSGYPAYGYYNAPPTPGPYGQPSYGQGVYGGQVYGQTEEKKKSKFGMGTGLAVGAVAGALGGLALMEGAEYVEDKIADKVAEKVEDDLYYDGDF